MLTDLWLVLAAAALLIALAVLVDIGPLPMGEEWRAAL